MTLATLLVVVPVAVPLLAAGLALLLGPWPTAQRVLGTTVPTAVVVDAALLLHRADAQGPVVAQAGGYPVPLGITLVADRFSALVLLVSSIVLLLVVVYAMAQGMRGGTVPSVFHPSHLVLLAGVALSFLTGDLFTLFVGLEVMLMASYALITLRPNRARVRASMTYIVTSLLSSILLLSSVAVVYGLTGTLNLAQLSRRVGDLDPDVQAWLSVMLLLALAIKAAIVPMHWWLPESYPPAPAPVTAIFAALLTKVAVYAIIRTQTLFFPRDEPWTLLLILSAVTLLVGAFGALAQDNLHGALSFLLVSHIGYMLLGLAVSTQEGVAASGIYLVHHIVVQAGLFCVVGLVEHHRGTASVRRLGGVAVTAPVLSVIFLLPALSLGGVPPSDGFVAKLAVLRAAVGTQDALPLVVAGVGLLTGLLTLAVMARIWSSAFWGEPAAPVPDPDPTDELVLGTGSVMRGMTVATACLMLLGLGVAAGAGPVSDLATRAGEDLRSGVEYRESVLGGEGR
ncbi:proton-conducting transporter membrane subunit [Janibacter sp. DB-40]|uniref:proton-conducting transporter transmembrane domain-containing protein n=1 Tax=Janibacter sp. DB-40 TaxID=3028808 RepID=UPI0024065E2B|nr:proton-conducting transporter membrane subunit [Janibacter sp. DB-40]